MSGSSRITNRHLERSAAVYVRQSTQNQVLKNRESRAAPVWAGGPCP